MVFICDINSFLAITEDIGRHNTLDKLIGECLLRKIPTEGKILVASGRISSEMLRKRYYADTDYCFFDHLRKGRLAWRVIQALL
jgi:formate dehydrogenase accessory protein FdhD